MSVFFSNYFTTEILFQKQFADFTKLLANAILSYLPRNANISPSPQEVCLHVLPNYSTDVQCVVQYWGIH